MLASLIMKKKPVIMARIVPLKKADDSFDITFWQRVGAKGIFDAMCEMVKDYYKWRGHGRFPGFRRDVAVLKRR